MKIAGGILQAILTVIVIAAIIVGSVIAGWLTTLVISLAVSVITLFQINISEGFGNFLWVIISIAYSGVFIYENFWKRKKK